MRAPLRPARRLTAAQSALIGEQSSPAHPQRVGSLTPRARFVARLTGGALMLRREGGPQRVWSRRCPTSTPRTLSSVRPPRPPTRPHAMPFSTLAAISDHRSSLRRAVAGALPLRPRRGRRGAQDERQRDRVRAAAQHAATRPAPCSPVLYPELPPQHVAVSLDEGATWSAHEVCVCLSVSLKAEARVARRGQKMSPALGRQLPHYSIRVVCLKSFILLKSDTKTAIASKAPGQRP